MMHVKPREIWFIRHGESVANAGARTDEASGYALTELGFRQAGQVATALPHIRRMHDQLRPVRKRGGDLPGLPEAEFRERVS